MKILKIGEIERIEIEKTDIETIEIGNIDTEKIDIGKTDTHKINKIHSHLKEKSGIEIDVHFTGESKLEIALLIDQFSYNWQQPPNTLGHPANPLPPPDGTSGGASRLLRGPSSSAPSAPAP